MSSKIVCDRCGTVGVKTPIKIRRGALDIDLCRGCLNDFDDKFMTNKAALERYVGGRNLRREEGS